MNLPKEIQDRIDIFLLRICIFFVWLLFIILGHRFAGFYFDKNLTLVVTLSFGFLGILIGLTLAGIILKNMRG